MEHEIKGWEGYFLNITKHSIDVYSSWGFSSGRPLKGQKREIIIIENRRKKFLKEYLNRVIFVWI